MLWIFLDLLNPLNFLTEFFNSLQKIYQCIIDIEYINQQFNGLELPLQQFHDIWTFLKENTKLDQVPIYF